MCEFSHQDVPQPQAWDVHCMFVFEWCIAPCECSLIGWDVPDVPPPVAWLGARPRLPVEGVFKGSAGLRTCITLGMDKRV